jgi:hypothetical protein
MYEVNINADPEHFLDWNKPLGADSPARQTLRDYSDVFIDHSDPQLRNAAKDAYIAASNPDLTGQGVHDTLTKVLGGDKVAAANAMKNDIGAPGIKYLDAGSRAAGDGSRNYVVFDPSIIEIMRKYGLAGLTTMGGLGGLGGLSQAGDQQPPDSDQLSQ